ncbi:MAG TPA: 1-(5-phosphoribosyl)-5-((5-phosphoribosylamino)methylideneamino)imidazole-4-carboxamide isomerase, partial [Spirochaetia bacterium]|nr:1-(5-phosphoribosyl)-5-((5-phosphoribosylamino)methylideneamino)imidazole-4-carboxamide isomerase [Spirochaetia bacterium]
MQAIPAIDLKDNRVVRLERGRKEQVTVYHDSPVAQALFFAEQGAERIHIVDLDGAFSGAPVHSEVIMEIRKVCPPPILLEVGGG